MRKNVSIILLFVMLISMILPVNGADNINCDYATHWANEEITRCLSQGIITGYPDGSVKPDAIITRAEFFSIVNNTFNFTQNQLFIVAQELMGQVRTRKLLMVMLLLLLTVLYFKI